MRRSIPRLALIVLCLLAACAEEAAESPEAPASPEAAAPPEVPAEAPSYTARGLVANIMASRKTLIIDHEAIDGYMEAMSMPFSVADTSLLTGIAPQDSVRFRFEVSTSLGVITEIEKIE